MDRTAFALDDGDAHRFVGCLVGKIAIAMEISNGRVDPERKEHGCHRAGHVFAHRKHRPSDPQWRQDLEHVIILGLADLEPFACVEWCGITIPTVWALRVAIEHAEHLLAACDAPCSLLAWSTFVQ
ncbi:hypothetical protein ABIA10_007383 [Rhizobium leguminosarum]